MPSKVGAKCLGRSVGTLASRELADTGRVVAEKVGSTIRELRKGKGLTQAQLALPAFSISFISALERGKICPSLRALFFLAKRLGVSPAYLLGGGASSRDRAAGVGYVSPNPQAALESDVALKQAEVLLLQQAEAQAEALLAPLRSKLLTIEQNYALFLLGGQLALERNDYSSAEEQFQRAIVQADALQGNNAGCVARNLLGLARFLLGNYQQAQELHRQCLSDQERENLPDPLFAIEVIGNLASDYFALNEAAQAAPLYQRALQMYEGVVGQRPCQVSTVMPIARAYQQTSSRYGGAGKWGLSREFASRALSLYKMRATHRCVGLIHQGLGKVRERLGDFDGAEREYRRALARVQELMDDSALALCHISLAELHLSRGHRESALGDAEVAIAHARAGSDPQTMAEAMLTLGAIHQAGKNFEEADTLITQALTLLEASHALELAARGYARYANQLEGRGEDRRSLAAWKKAYSLRQASQGSDPSL